MPQVRAIMTAVGFQLRPDGRTGHEARRLAVRMGRRGISTRRATRRVRVRGRSTVRMDHRGISTSRRYRARSEWRTVGGPDRPPWDFNEVRTYRLRLHVLVSAVRMDRRGISTQAEGREVESRVRGRRGISTGLGGRSPAPLGASALLPGPPWDFNDARRQAGEGRRSRGNAVGFQRTRQDGSAIRGIDHDPLVDVDLVDRCDRE